MMERMQAPRCAFVTLCAATLALGAINDPVRIAGGVVSGATDSSAGVSVYKGIPYAAPPTGDLRWKSPRPVTPWQGIHEATKFSAACYQTPYARTSIYYRDPEPMSEDCLYLNIWTAAKSAKEHRPVMVWIHGGALTRGSASIPTYGGEALAKLGVVVVSLNYRLNIFGFFAHSELSKESDRNASGNYGILDQIAALEWVQKNIAAFGGDPKRVTIFGESAGSWSVNYLMATPLARGLFQRVIGESGANFAMRNKLSDMEAAGAKFATSMKAESLAALRAKPAADLVNAPATAGFTPNVDGWMLPQDVYTIFAAGKQNDVPLLAGSNADEGKSLIAWPANGTSASFVEQSRRRFGEQADAYLKVYPSSTNEEAAASAYATLRDMTFGWQMRTWARMQTKTGKSKAYLYYFDRVPPGPESARYGSYHASEIAYVFGNLEPPRPWEDTDRKLSHTMSSYWVNFATTGDPNGKGLVKWPAYQESSDTVIELGDKIELRPTPHKAALDFLDSYFVAQRSAK